MKVLVTGGCGFLGSHICEHYIKKNWGVIAYDNLTKFEYSRVPYFDTEKVRDYNLKFLEGMGVAVVIDDIRNMKMLSKVARNCDYIIHTAAQPAMTIAIENPQLDFEVNVQGTLNVLEAARQSRIPIVNCSTIHVYGTGINESLKEGKDRFYLYDGTTTPQSIDEDEKILTGKITPLHASKRASEIYIQTYIDTYGLRAANFRLTGMYGPRQFGGEDHGWVANFAIRTILGLPIKIFGTDKQVRDILYVKDAVKAFDAWHMAGCPSGTYNIGGGEDCITSIRGCLEILKRQTGMEQDISMEPERIGDLYYFCCDTSKAKKEFSWFPRVLPYDGINDLVYWIRGNKELFSGRNL